MSVERQDGTERRVARYLMVPLAFSAALGMATAPAGAQAPAIVPDAAVPPFFAGERLTYGVRLSRFGGSGKGEMSVEGPVEIRGISVYLLKSTVETRVGPMKVVNRTESWLDATRMAALRFRKRERSFGTGGGDESVEMFPEQRRWEAKDGRAGDSMSDAPLDELSFIYFLRTVSLDADSVYRFDRHFDTARNPTTVRVVGREEITTPAGRFSTVVVEMRVRDAGRYNGDGIIRINLSDDPCRLPVRIESSVPVAGKATLTLERFSHQPGHPDIVKR
jgi:hypothetical protein